MKKPPVLISVALVAAAVSVAPLASGDHDDRPPPQDMKAAVPLKKPRPREIDRWQPTPEEIRIAGTTEAILHGKVLDHFGQPVPGAELICTPTATPGDPRSIALRSAQDGTFLLKEPDCSAVRIAASAPGYYPLSSSYGSYSFAAIPASLPESLREQAHPPTKTSPENPVILTLRKMAAREPLLHKSHSAVLKEQQFIGIGQAHDQRISVKYSFNPEVKRMHVDGWEVHDWAVEIKVEGGGIIETTPPAPDVPDSFIAPADGYHPSVRYSFDNSMTDRDLKWTITRNFYIRFDNGTFARVEAAFKAKPKRPWTVVESWYNPSKSRNTEYDPNIRIEDPPR